MSDDIDIVVLASRDTDLIPVLDQIYDMHRADSSVARIETFTWYDRNGAKNFGSLRASYKRNIWNTNLGRDCYEASLDRKDYT